MRVRYVRLLVRLGLALTAVAVVATGVHLLTQQAGEVRAIGPTSQRQLLPLMQLMELHAAGHVELERILQEPNVAARIPRLEGILRRRQATDAIWLVLKPELAALPGTGPGIAAYEGALADGLATSEYSQQVVLAADPSTLSSDPRFTALRTAQDAQRAAIAGLFRTTAADSVVAPSLSAANQLDTLGRYGIAWALFVASAAMLIAGLSAQTVRRDVRALLREATEVAAHARGLKFEQDVGTALSMAHSEVASLRIVEEALAGIGLPGTAELLLADSSQAHLEPVVVVGPEGAGPQCAVRTPQDCPAVTRGQSITFQSSDDLAACPYLTHRPGGACSATCVPLSISSRSVGVVHAVGPEGHPPTDEQEGMLTSLASRLGDHLTRVRATSETIAQASVDALTGLANRRSFENQFRKVVRQGEPFALAFGDIDHFKRLNDEYGHETGDRALRILSRTMRSSVRDLDLLARWGGEEFVLLLPGLTSAQAVEILERVRANLTIEQASGAIPPFTISFGVVDDTHGTELDELLRRADRALMVAKQGGRNRIVVSDGIDAPGEPEGVLA